MVNLEPQAPIRLLQEQAYGAEKPHMIYEQYKDRKKLSLLRLPDRRKSFLWLVALICIVCVVLAIVATLNPVPVFDASKGLLSVVALYPGSAPKMDRTSKSKTEFASQTKEKRDHQYEIETLGEQRIWNAECECYRPRFTSRIYDDVYDTTTYTTSTATGIITLKPISTSTSRPRPTSTPKPTKRPQHPQEPEKSKDTQVDPGTFAGMFLGLTGACLQRRSGVLVCTANSFSPQYTDIYDIAGLSSNVTAQLPTGTGGASVGLLIALIIYVCAALGFVASASPIAWFYGPRGHKTLGSSGTLPDLRHQWTIILATGLAAIATFTVVISSVQLQNAFGSSAEAREAWDKTNTLEAKLLIAYGYLYACAALGGAIVISSLAMIAYDFQHPWWLPRAQDENLRLQGIPSEGGGFGKGLDVQTRPHATSFSTIGGDYGRDTDTVVGGHRSPRL